MPFPAYQNDYVIWASGGVTEEPPASKVEIGWERERPPFEYQNWWQERVDNLLFEFNRGEHRGSAMFPGTGSTADGEWDRDVTNQFRRGVLASENCRAMARTGVILCSRSVQNSDNDMYTLTMGYVSSGSGPAAPPSEDNITIQLKAMGGDIYAKGEVSAGSGNFGGQLGVAGQTSLLGYLLVMDNARVDGDLDVGGEITSEGVPVWAESNVASHVGQFMGSTSKVEARESIDLTERYYAESFGSGGTLINNYSVRIQRIGRWASVRIYAATTDSDGFNGTLSVGTKIEPEFSPSEGTGVTAGILINQNSSQTDDIKVTVNSDGSIIFGRNGGPVQVGNYSGTLSWPLSSFTGVNQLS